MSNEPGTEDIWQHHWSELIFHLKAATVHLHECQGGKFAHRGRVEDLMRETRRFMLEVTKLTCVSDPRSATDLGTFLEAGTLTGEHEVKQVGDALAVLALLLERDLGVGDHALELVLLVPERLEETRLVRVQQAARDDVLVELQGARRERGSRSILAASPPCPRPRRPSRSTGTARRISAR